MCTPNIIVPVIAAAAGGKAKEAILGKPPEPEKINPPPDYSQMEKDARRRALLKKLRESTAGEGRQATSTLSTRLGQPGGA